MVVPLTNALESLDDSLIEAAYDLGGNALVDREGRSYSRMRRPASPRAAIVVFMLTLGNYLTPTLLGGKNSLWFTEQIYTQFITRFNWEQGAAFGFLLLILSTAIVWLGLQLQRPELRRRDAPVMIPSLPRSAHRALRDRRLRRGVLRVSLRAFAGGRGVRLQQRELSGAAVARLYARLVRRAAARAAAWACSPTGRCCAASRTSVVVAAWVTLLSVIVGTVNAFLLERAQFRGKSLLSLLMLAPLVIPGVILGISILAFASRLAQFADDLWGLEVDFLRPGLPLVVAGQFAYIVSIATLTIAARLKRFDADAGGGCVQPRRDARARSCVRSRCRTCDRHCSAPRRLAFLMSFENFNTTLMLVGSDPPLTIMMYGRMREGASPVLNAVSLLLMVASALLALVFLRSPARDAGGR